MPTRRRVAVPHRPDGRAIERPSARVSLLHLLATLILAAVVWGAGTIYTNAYNGRIYPHITIDHVPVGGMTRDEALQALRDTEAARTNSIIYVQAGGKSWRVTPAEFGTRYDIDDAVAHALSLAHGGPPILGGWTELQTMWNGANVSLSGSHDSAAVGRFLAGVASAVHVPPKSASVGVSGGGVEIVRHSVNGVQLDRTRAAAALGAAVNTHNATAVTLPLQPVQSALGDATAEAAVDRADDLLAAPIQFEWTGYTPQQWILEPKDLLRLLTFTPRCAAGSCQFAMGINVGKLAEAFNRSGVALRVDRAPTPASYVLFPASNPLQASVQVVPDHTGIAIDVNTAAARLLQQAGVAPGSRTILLPTVTLYSSFSAAAALALDFNQAVGYSGMSFKGIDWARRDNLNIAANVISDTIVGPNQTFSLSGRAGPLTGQASAQYKNGGYIRGQDAVGPGDITGANSGVDLLASAVLAAAYDAGLPITQRAHYPYLSAFTPPGLDAIVSYGVKHGPDLAFRNTTGHPILIMTSNDGLGGVSVYIFNRAGYAPSHQQGSYTSTTALPQVTLNPNGSADATISRQVTVNGHATQDQISSHYAPIDP